MRGLRLNIVRDDGQAKAAGLQAGDVLLKYNGIDLDSADALTVARNAASPGDAVEYLRGAEMRRAILQPGLLGVTYAEVDASVDYEAFALASKVADMVVTTSHVVDGFAATRQLGVVTAECVFGLNAIKDFFTSVSDVFGGRSQTAQSALRDAREYCITELKREAAARGANAVIAVDLDYSEFSGQGKSMLFLVSSGTAVFLEKKA